MDTPLDDKIQMIFMDNGSELSEAINKDRQLAGSQILVDLSNGLFEAIKKADLSAYVKNKGSADD